MREVMAEMLMKDHLLGNRASQLVVYAHYSDEHRFKKKISQEHADN